MWASFDFDFWCFGFGKILPVHPASFHGASRNEFVPNSNTHHRASLGCISRSFQSFIFTRPPPKKEVKKMLVQNTRIQWTNARVFFVFGNEFDPKSHNHLMHLLSNISVFVKHCKNYKTALVQIIEFGQNSGIWSSSWNVVKIVRFLVWHGLV